MKEPATVANQKVFLRGLSLAVTALSLAGCLAEEPVDTGAFEDSPAGLAPQGVFPNQLSAQSLARNGLTANPDANVALISNRLHTATFMDASAPLPLRHQLRHPGTQEVMKYLVECALDNTQAVAYDDTSIPSAAPEYTWHGKVGLCPSWGNGPVNGNTVCQELVSACVVARVNAFNLSVPLSLRGETPGTAIDPLSPFATVVAEVVDINGNEIASFEACGSPTSGATRNCGWFPDHVGRCTPGATVGIGAGSKPASRCTETSYPNLGTSNGDTVLRVCEGTRGCDNGGLGFIKDDGGSCGSPYPGMWFQCPASGTFSVMSGPQDSNGPGKASPAVREGGPATYPNDEQDVFSFEEGAFYGNIFGVDALHASITPAMNKWDVVAGAFITAPDVAKSSGMVYRRMFACSGRYWSTAEAYEKHRVCAGPGPTDATTYNCAARYTGACAEAYYDPPAVASCPGNLHKCNVIDGPKVVGDGDYHACGGGGVTWHNPITVYLNDPEDIVPEQHSGTVSETALLCP